MNADRKRTLKAEALTREGFSPFGEVIEVASAKQALDINQGFTTRYHDLAGVDVSAKGGRVCVSIFRSTPMIPVVINVMERHPLGSQAFFPLGAQSYLVVVAPVGDFDAAEARAFLAGGHQGVNYAKGVWHHFLLALDAESDFLVIDREGPGGNLDEIALSPAERFVVEY